MEGRLPPGTHSYADRTRLVPFALRTSTSIGARSRSPAVSLCIRASSWATQPGGQLSR